MTSLAAQTRTSESLVSATAAHIHTSLQWRNATTYADEEAWEYYKAIILRHWIDYKWPLPKVITLMEKQYKFKSSQNAYKKHLKKWGAFKNISGNEKSELLQHITRDRQAGSHAIYLKRGQSIRINDIQQKASRQRRAARIKTGRLREDGPSKPSCIVRLQQTPDQVGLSNIFKIQNFEKLFREMNNLLYKSSSSGICAPSSMQLSWLLTSAYAQENAINIRDAISKGTRYYLEGKHSEAFLCWKHSMLQLEDLIPQVDLDVWTYIIQCCLLLQKHGATEISETFWKHLKGLCHSRLDLKAQHKSFVDALLEIDPPTLITGGIQILETKLKMIQNIWPESRRAWILYELDLAEAQACAGLTQMEADLSVLEGINPIAAMDIKREARFHTYRIWSCVLKEDLQTAEEIARHAVEQMQNVSQNVNVDLEFAHFYAILARTQWLRRDYEAARFYFIHALRFHQKRVSSATKYGGFNLAEIHRILYQLDWLSVAEESTVADGNTMWASERQMLENHWQKKIEGSIKGSTSNGYAQVDAQLAMPPVRSRTRAVPSEKSIPDDPIPSLRRVTFANITAEIPAIFATAREGDCIAVGMGELGSIGQRGVSHQRPSGGGGMSSTPQPSVTAAHGFSYLK